MPSCSSSRYFFLGKVTQLYSDSLAPRNRGCIVRGCGAGLHMLSMCAWNMSVTVLHCVCLVCECNCMHVAVSALCECHCVFPVLCSCTCVTMCSFCEYNSA